MRLPASPRVRLLLGVSLFLFCLIAVSTGSAASGLQAVALFIAAPIAGAWLAWRYARELLAATRGALARGGIGPRSLSAALVVALVAPLASVLVLHGNTILLEPGDQFAVGLAVGDELVAVRPVNAGDGLVDGWCELRVGKGSSGRVVQQLQRWRVTAGGATLYPIGAPFEQVWTSVTPGALTVRATYDDAQLWGRIGEVTLRNPDGAHVLRFRLGSRFWRVYVAVAAGALLAILVLKALQRRSLPPGGGPTGHPGPPVAPAGTTARGHHDGPSLP